MLKYIVAIAGLSASSFMVEAASLGGELEIANVTATVIASKSETCYSMPHGNVIGNNPEQYCESRNEIDYQLGYAIDLSDNWAIVPKVGTEQTLGVRYATDFGLSVSANLGTANYLAIGWRF